MTRDASRITINGLSKSFGPNVVLAGIDLTVRGGEVLVLMGANGAGKPTLVRILSGVYQPDDGVIEIDGQRHRFDTPQQAKAAGIVTVHQIINDGVVQNLTVAENLLLDQLCDGRMPTFVNTRALHRQAARIIEKSGIDLPLSAYVSELGQADRQMLAIARALAENPKMLILDEPTSSLSEQEAERLFAAIERMRQQGVAVLYISHRMSDIRRLADRIAALREGRIVGFFSPPLDYSAAVDAMLGKTVGAVRHAPVAGDATVMEFKRVQVQKGASPFDCVVRSGEIVVLTGLLSSGCSRLAEIVFGMHALPAGSITLDGKPWNPAHPADAIRQGVFMVQEDRGNNAVIPAFSIEQNVSLPFLADFSRSGFVRRKTEQEKVRHSVKRAEVKYTDLAASMTTLSGGNQQKAMIARWMMAPCRVLLLNEPFQGVDIGARRQIGALLRQTAPGRATIAVCTDVEEALEIADRIFVFNHGSLMGIHTNGAIDMATLIHQIAAAPSPSTATTTAETE